MELQRGPQNDQRDKYYGPGLSRVTSQLVKGATTQPSTSKQSARLRLRQVNIGVLRSVKQLAFVSRNS
jgi:hypothetical protein